MRTPAALALALAFTCAPSTARASKGDPMQLQALFGLGGTKTDWRTDFGGYSSLKLGLKPNDYFSVYFLGKLGAGTVDERMLTLVSLGVQVWPVADIGGVQPFARLSICHQHEETLFVVKDDPIGAIFGIGDGIRHRGGFEGALGMDIPIYAHDGIEAYGSFEGSAIWFYDPRGPSWYVGATGGIGLSYDL